MHPYPIAPSKMHPAITEVTLIIMISVVVKLLSVWSSPSLLLPPLPLPPLPLPATAETKRYSRTS